MKKYNVGHARGSDFKQLKSLGFVVFYPMMDDYVFLEVTPENKALVRRQSELGVLFLKERNKFVEVTEDELSVMKMETVGQIKVGVEIRVLGGYCENLEGVVEAMDGDTLQCCLKGFNRVYRVELAVTDVVLKGGTPLEPVVELQSAV